MGLGWLLCSQVSAASQVSTQPLPTTRSPIPRADHILCDTDALALGKGSLQYQEVKSRPICNLL